MLPSTVRSWSWSESGGDVVLVTGIWTCGGAENVSVETVTYNVFWNTATEQESYKITYSRARSPKHCFIYKVYILFIKYIYKYILYSNKMETKTSKSYLY